MVSLLKFKKTTAILKHENFQLEGERGEIMLQSLPSGYAPTQKVYGLTDSIEKLIISDTEKKLDFDGT